MTVVVPLDLFETTSSGRNVGLCQAEMNVRPSGPEVARCGVRRSDKWCTSGEEAVADG